MNEFNSDNYEHDMIDQRDAQPAVQISRAEVSQQAGNTTNVSDYHAQLKAKYGKVYRLEQPIFEDDDHDRMVTLYFKRPLPSSFDRYVKNIPQSAIRASKAFLLDSVTDESRDMLVAELVDNPGMAMSIASKLTDLLGMSNGINLKLL